MSAPTTRLPGTARPVHRWKSYELEAFPDVPELRFEIVGGELIVSRRPRWHHQFTVTALAKFFFDKVMELGGVALAEPGIVWEDEAEDNVVPDVAVILADRMDILGEKTLTGMPNLVIEVISEYNADADYVKKRHMYQRTGAQEYWIVDPFERQIEVWRFDQNKAVTETFQDGDTVTTSLVPGVAVPVAEVWMKK